MMNFNSISGLNSAMGAKQNYGNAFAPATSALNASLGQAGLGNTIKTPISPKAFSNQGTMASMFGQAMPGTFNRNVGGHSPIMQSTTEGRMTSQGYMPGIDPTDASLQPDIDAIQATSGMPVPPPVGVQQPIAPFYDLSTK